MGDNDETHEEWEINEILDYCNTKCFSVQYKATD
jgi:hypothetical protein